ncbi:CapA family protein [Laceyella putida]|uniref:CapA family protein n=1 Tax=Laceyella putida TaxID=110101 RepID=A0ABW2RFL3_9BACL
MLTWRQELQRYIKKQKKKATLHTAIATVATAVLVFTLNAVDRAQAVTVDKDPNSALTVTLVGDMMFGRNIQDVIVPRFGYEYLFNYVEPYFAASDYVTGNFENPVTNREGYPEADKFIHLSTQPEAVKALKKIGFSSVNLANNHMKDFGKQGLLDTLRAFDGQNVDTVGAGRDLKEATRISYETVHGIRVAVLGFSDVMPKDFRARKDKSGIAPADPDVFFPLVAKAKSNADLVLVHMHWGLEYDSGYHPRQQDLAHALVDAGADVVIGHHPHVLEPVEVYKNGVILYSLGNFVFDQGWSRTRESVLVQYKILKGGKEAKLELHPMMIREGQPRPLEGWTDAYRREKIFNQLTEEMMYSEKWKQTWTREGNHLSRTIPLTSAGKKQGTVE